MNKALSQMRKLRLIIWQRCQKPSREAWRTAVARHSPNDKYKGCFARGSKGRQGWADLARVPGAGLRDVALVHGLSTGHTARFVLRKGCASGLRQGPQIPRLPAS